MALEEFWESVWVRNPYWGTAQSPPDFPQVTREGLDADLTKRQAKWQPRGVLTGYDEKDFDFLEPEEQRQLTELVRGFNEVAPQLRWLWGRARNAEDEQELKELTDRARPYLQDIIFLLKQDRYRGAEALRYGKLVERELGGTLPDGVVELRFSAGGDWTGDPGLFVWVFLSDAATATDKQLAETVNRVSPVLSATVRRVAPDHFPYISFRGVSERIEEDAAA